MGFGACMGTMGATRWSAKCCGYTAERTNKGDERPEAIIEPAIAKTARIATSIDLRVTVDLDAKRLSLLACKTRVGARKTRSTDVS
jgi:hypothetical protein